MFLEEREKVGLALEGDFPLRREMVIAPSKSQARKLATDWSAARYKTYLKWGLGETLDNDAKGFGSDKDQDIDARFILGSADDCAEALNDLREDLGMTQFMFKAHWPGVPHSESMRQLELFGTKIIPQLRKA